MSTKDNFNDDPKSPSKINFTSTLSSYSETEFFFPVLKNIEIGRFQDDAQVDLNALISTLPNLENSEISNLKDEMEISEKKLMNVEESKLILRKVEDVRRQRSILFPSILRLQPLGKIVENFKETKLKRAGGIPTCISVSKYIAIGTSRGVVFIFDHFEKLQMMFGTREGVEFGAVTSIDISTDNNLLIVGHNGGELVLWDFNQKRSMKAIKGIHSKPVVHVKFYGDNKHVLSVDLAGVVYCLSFTQVPLVGYISDSILVLEGIGIIKDLAVLQKDPTVTHSVDDYQLAACVTQEMVTILSSYNGVKKIMNLLPPEKAQKELPLLAWRKVVLDTLLKYNTGEQKWVKKDPMLVVVWGNILQLVQVAVITAEVKDPKRDLDFVVLVELQLQFTVKALSWLGNKVLVMLTSTEELVVFDPFTITTMEKRNYGDLMPLYHGLYQNQNPPSENHKQDPLISYQNAMVVHQNRFYILGLNGCFEGHIMTWEERLDILVKEGRWFEAISLTLEFFDGKAQAAAGLPRDPILAHRILNTKISEILTSYVSYHLSNPQEDQDHYLSVATNVIDCCLNIKREDLPFEVLYPLFVQAKQEEAFLMRTVPFILGDRLRRIPQAIFERIVEIRLGMGDIKTIEKILLHLDLSTIDFYSAVSLCRRHLSSALFYIFPVALDDFIFPLDDHIRFIMRNEQKIKKNHQQILPMLCLKVLLYLSSCFKGYTYPLSRRIPTLRASQLTEQLFQYLFDEDVPPFTNPYPHATVLLKYTCREFLNVLALPFEGLGVNQQLNSLVEILVNLMIDRRHPVDDPDVLLTDKSDWMFTLSQQGDLFLFVAKNISRGLIQVDDYLTIRMLMFLMDPRNPNNLKERENHLLDLVHFYSPFRKPSTPNSSADGNIPLQEENSEIKFRNGKFFTYDFIVPKASAAHFHRVQEFYYLEAREYRKVILARILAPEDKDRVFDYLKNWLTIGDGEKSLRIEEQDEVRLSTIQHIQELINIDYIKASELVTLCFYKDHQVLVDMLRSTPEVLYKYFKGLDFLMTRHKQNLEEEKDDGEVQLLLTADEEDFYFELMCKLDPSQTVPFLLHHNQYRPAQCLPIATTYDLTEATALLHERLGNLMEAVAVYLLLIDGKTKALELEICSSTASLPVFDEHLFPNSPSEKELKEAITGCIGILQRNTTAMEESLNQTLWFRLLDSLVQPLNQYYEASSKKALRAPPVVSRQRAVRKMDHIEPVPRPPVEKQYRVRRGLTILIKEIINNMMSHVALTSIVEKILKNHSKEKFGEFKAIFLSLIDVTTYDCTTMNTCYSLLQEDAFKQQEILMDIRNRPVREEKIEIRSRSSNLRKQPPHYQLPLPTQTTPERSQAIRSPSHHTAPTLHRAPNSKSYKDGNRAIQVNPRIALIIDNVEPNVSLLDLFHMLRHSNTMDLDREEKIRLGQQLVPELPGDIQHVDLSPLQDLSKHIQIAKQKSHSLKSDGLVVRKGVISRVDLKQLYGLVS